MSEVEEWRGHVAELRQVAEHAVDVERQQKLFALADRWEAFAKELERPNALRRIGASVG